jgi:putative heme-binding domain-containing protein
VVAFTRQKFEGDLSTQFRIYNTLQEGLAQKGSKSGKDLLDWGVKLAEVFIQGRNTWAYRTSGNTMLTRNPIISHQRKPDTTSHTFIGFDQSGFKGYIISPVFEIPATLTFTATINEGNKKSDNDPSGHIVRLRLAEDTSQVLARSHFLKEETWVERFIETEWNLTAFQGKKGYLEIYNGPYGNVNIGNFRPSTVQVPAVSPNEVAARQKFALEVIGNNRLTAFGPRVKACLTDATVDPFVRLVAARSLLQLDVAGNASIIGAMLADTTQPLLYRKEIAEIMGEFPLPGVNSYLSNALTGAPYDFQLALVKALAASAEGKTALLSQVRSGKLSAQILMDPKVEERILLNCSQKQKRDYKELTAHLDPVNGEREKLIRQRVANFSTSNIQKETGRVLFVQNCSPCHQIAKEGGMIGPQLDGVGNWGAQLLATKILDPNRNISEAFRTYTIRLKDGKVLSGLYRREEGEVLVFANIGGEEFTVAKQDIAEKQASKYTLMPDHFGETLEQENFNSLLSYLLSVK